jgi:circadian clock protein KaiC
MERLRTVGAWTTKSKSSSLFGRSSSETDQQQTLLYSADLELGETTKRIFEAVERVNPSRVVLDSLSEIRLLAQSSLRYRRQILAIKHYFSRRGATVVLLDDLTAEAIDQTAHSIAHGVIRLEQLAPNYGAERRRLRVLKYRGQQYRGGHHDFTIAKGASTCFHGSLQPSIAVISAAPSFRRA